MSVITRNYYGFHEIFDFTVTYTACTQSGRVGMIDLFLETFVGLLWEVVPLPRVP